MRPTLGVAGEFLAPRPRDNSQTPVRPGADDPPGRASHFPERLESGRLHAVAATRAGLHLRTAVARSHWADDSTPSAEPR